MAVQGTYNKRMQVLAYIATCAIFCGTVPALGWVNKTLDLQISHDVILLILGGMLGLFVDLTKKIFRISEEKPKSGDG